MPSIIKLALPLAIAFLSTFLVLKATGLLTVEQIKMWFEQTHQLPILYLLLLVIILLWLDLFIAMPTLTVSMLSGYFLGHHLGFVASITGLLLAGCSGYLISYRFGDFLLNRIVKQQDKINQATQSFNQHGFVMILLSRALPVLPEVSACLAGITKMPFYRFLLAWCLSSIPYVFIASYAGSISTSENPKPAIYTALSLSIFFSAAWYWFNRYQTKKG